MKNLKDSLFLFLIIFSIKPAAGPAQELAAGPTKEPAKEVSQEHLARLITDFFKDRRKAVGDVPPRYQIIVGQEDIQGAYFTGKRVKEFTEWMKFFSRVDSLAAPETICENVGLEELAKTKKMPDFCMNLPLSAAFSEKRQLISMINANKALPAYVLSMVYFYQTQAENHKRKIKEGLRKSGLKSNDELVQLNKFIQWLNGIEEKRNNWFVYAVDNQDLRILSHQEWVSNARLEADARFLAHTYIRKEKVSEREIIERFPDFHELIGLELANPFFDKP